MQRPILKRHVAWDHAIGWHRCHSGAGHEPGRILSWIEDNLTDSWSHRLMSTQEIVKAQGRAPAGQFIFEFAFADAADADKFIIAFGAPAGSS